MPSITSEATFDLGGLTDPLRFCGHRDQNLNALEALIPVVLRLDGDHVHVSGDRDAVRRAEDVLTAMLAAARAGTQVTPDDVSLAARTAGERGIPPTLATTPRGREVRPKTNGQRALVAAIESNTLTFAIGPAGTGKTFLAIVMAVRALKNRDVSRIVLTRPAVEAGEKLGFLPGDYKEKVDPYLRPLYDALQELLDTGVTERYLERGTIEVAPLAYMRGRTLGDAFVILDEAQNATHEQLKMFLTRLGAGSKMVVNGDDTQIDLPRGLRSGILDVERLFAEVDDVRVVRLDETDVVRHPLVGRIVAAYDRLSREREA
ncbi:MAG TPA: PhoH family protein [Candidatus Elarobacter sp.]|jgi:phosphate starvation-inducible PhoH-like protein|nr:PhoH family protein [Candidatus Elarobacter sp.]